VVHETRGGFWLRGGFCALECPKYSHKPEYSRITSYYIEHLIECDAGAVIGVMGFREAGRRDGATDYGGLRGGSAARGLAAKTRYVCDVT